MFIFDYLTEHQIEIPLLEIKVNDYFQEISGVLIGRHYNALYCEIKRNLPNID